MFTSFLFKPAFGVVDLKQKTVNALGSWDTSVTVTTPEDIGALTVRVVLATPRITNQVVYTAGDTLSYGQLADKLDAALGKHVQRVQWSVPMLRAELAQAPHRRHQEISRGVCRRQWRRHLGQCRSAEA
jgi:hypothetical protein